MVRVIMLFKIVFFSKSAIPQKKLRLFSKGLIRRGQGGPVGNRRLADLARPPLRVSEIIGYNRKSEFKFSNWFLSYSKCRLILEPLNE